MHCPRQCVLTHMAQKNQVTVMSVIVSLLVVLLCFSGIEATVMTCLFHDLQSGTSSASSSSFSSTRLCVTLPTRKGIYIPVIFTNLKRLGSYSGWYTHLPHTHTHTHDCSMCEYRQLVKSCFAPCV